MAEVAIRLKLFVFLTYICVKIINLTNFGRMQLTTRKRALLVILLLTGIFWSIEVLFGWNMTFGILERQLLKSISSFTKTTTARNEPILILAWNKAWVKWEKFMDGCSPDLNCIITLDRERFNESSAVIIHIPCRDMSTIPSIRDPRTYFVYFDLEPPTKTPRVPQKYRDTFNLSMTYRLESDVIFPYGEFVPSAQSKSDWTMNRMELEQTIAGKSKLIAWFVSKCKAQNHREEVVSRIERQTAVDIFGACGTKQCPWKPYGDQKTGLIDANQCHQLLTKTYKFYLSFENSICRDYVTEKFFSIIDNALIVPIVLNRRIVLDTARDLDTARVLNRSFISLDDFPSTEALVEYLKYLDANTTAYLEYFEWRGTHEISFDRWMKPGCELCRLLMKGQDKVLEDPDAFFLGTEGKPVCWNISSVYM